MPQKKNPGGRPSKYKPEYCDRLIAHMTKGLSFESFAGLVEVNQDTVHEWVKRHVEFSEAKKLGQSALRLWWERTGQEGLFNVMTRDGEGGNSTVTINSTMYVWMTKNMLGWRDKQDIDQKITDTGDKRRADDAEKERDELLTLCKRFGLGSE